MHRNTMLGLTGIVGIWLTAGFALPYVNILNMFTVGQLMIARGTVTALLAVLLLRFAIFPVNRFALLSGLGFAGGCLGLYHSIREIGPSLTIIIFTTAPIVNFAIAWQKGKIVSAAAIISLMLMLSGVVIALEPWGANNITALGLLWSVFGTISGALYFEALSKAHENQKVTWRNRLRLCFWQAFVVATIGFCGLGFTNPKVLMPNGKMFALVLGFAFIGGFLYFLSYIEAFTHLPIDAASVLAQGETPVVILMSGVILGEKLNWLQWAGVIISLYGTWYLSRWLAKQNTHDPPMLLEHN